LNLNGDVEEELDSAAKVVRERGNSFKSAKTSGKVAVG
jgi:hypothetical protein